MTDQHNGQQNPRPNNQGSSWQHAQQDTRQFNQRNAQQHAQPYSPQFTHAGGAPVYSPRPSLSAMAIAGFILGILGLLSSPVPIVNNGSFFLGVLGFIFGIIGLVACVRGKRRGKIFAIIAVILSVIACVVVLWTQSLYSDAIDSVTEGDKPAATVAPADPATGEGAEVSSEQQAVDYSNLAVGEVVELESGLRVSVTGVDRSLTNYDGSPLVGVTVSYENAGQSNASFNLYDWESQDASGVISSPTFSSQDGQLSSGTLVPGGTVSGVVCFEGDSVKVLYSSSIIADSSAGWNVA